MIAFKESIKPFGERFPLVSVIEKIFSNDGFLETNLNMEHRPEQEHMALSTAYSLENNSPLVFEAGTGVGKSLAYLIPSIIHSIEKKRQGVVSTQTISLQDQIKNKDLAICRKLFTDSKELQKYKDFKTAMMVGRANYLCPNRLRHAINSKIELFQSPQQSDLEQINDWANSTEHGLLEEIIPSPSIEVWDWVNADSSTCNPRTCNPETCYYQKAKSKVKEANIIIVNHSLLFTLIGIGSTPATDVPGILFANDFAVLDEAHRAPAIATERMGISLSSIGLDRLLVRLYNPKSKKGLFVKHGTSKDFNLINKTFNTAKKFFGHIEQNQLSSQDIYRLINPDWTDAILNRSLMDIEKRLDELSQDSENSNIKFEYQDFKMRVGSYRRSLNECIEMSDNKCVYWLEKTGRHKQNIVLRSAPLDISPYLKECLFKRQTSVLMTSATLFENKNLEKFLKKVGAVGQSAEIADSPFDFENKMKIFITTDMPVPNRSTGKIEIGYLTDMIRFCSLRIKGGSLVLFTNFKDMHTVAKELKEDFDKARRPFFVQGLGVSRTDITRKFREAGNGILFGTDSFWTGVDIPGPSLSQVIITRLPFENPSHPIAEARSEWIKNSGGNPFYEMTLSDAILRFRQGIGRLIRNKSDSGFVTILDSRIINKEYGKNFLSVLPNKRWDLINLSNRVEKFPKN